MTISKSKFIWLVTAHSIVLALCVAGIAQVAQTSPTKCGSPVENCIGNDCERGKPVIFGKPYVAPKLKLRVLDKHTNQPLARIKVNVSYIWEWLEYPYPERPFGVWSEQEYVAECITDDKGTIEVDSYKVMPHGWYKGIYSVGHKPRFKNIGVSFSLGKCFTGDEINRSTLDACKRKGKCEITMKTSCT